MLPVDILAFGAHPDDVELGCAGTLLHHIALGKRVGIVDLTRGELGTRGNAQIRNAEAMKAAERMGVSFRENLDLPDGFFRPDAEALLRLVRVIRACTPTLVLANAVRDRHPDHGRGSALVAEACFLAGLPRISSAVEGREQDPWRPRAVYHYIQDYNLKPDFLVDISKYMDEKIALVKTFRSQFYQEGDLAYREERDTPISGSDFLEFLRAKARAYGREAGFVYAEGFNVVRTPGLTDLFQLL